MENKEKYCKCKYRTKEERGICIACGLPIKPKQNKGSFGYHLNEKGEIEKDVKPKQNKVREIIKNNSLDKNIKSYSSAGISCYILPIENLDQAEKEINALIPSVEEIEKVKQPFLMTKKEYLHMKADVQWMTLLNNRLDNLAQALHNQWVGRMR